MTTKLRFLDSDKAVYWAAFAAYCVKCAPLTALIALSLDGYDSGVLTMAAVLTDLLLSAIYTIFSVLVVKIAYTAAQSTRMKLSDEADPRLRLLPVGKTAFVRLTICLFSAYALVCGAVQTAYVFEPRCFVIIRAISFGGLILFGLTVFLVGISKIASKKDVFLAYKAFLPVVSVIIGICLIYEQLTFMSSVSRSFTGSYAGLIANAVVLTVAVAAIITAFLVCKRRAEQPLTLLSQTEDITNTAVTETEAEFDAFDEQ